MYCCPRPSSSRRSCTGCRIPAALHSEPLQGNSTPCRDGCVLTFTLVVIPIHRSSSHQNGLFPALPCTTSTLHSVCMCPGILPQPAAVPCRHPRLTVLRCGYAEIADGTASCRRRTTITTPPARGTTLLLYRCDFVTCLFACGRRTYAMAAVRRWPQA